jgi:hypothetical protein
MKIALVVEKNYVINRIVVADDYTLAEGQHFDEQENVGIGDWYEEAEGIFYRPINGVPPDSPLADA